MCSAASATGVQKLCHKLAAFTRTCGRQRTQEYITVHIWTSVNTRTLALFLGGYSKTFSSIVHVQSQKNRTRGRGHTLNVSLVSDPFEAHLYAYRSSIYKWQMSLARHFRLSHARESTKVRILTYHFSSATPFRTPSRTPPPHADPDGFLDQIF